MLTIQFNEDITLYNIVRFKKEIVERELGQHGQAT